MQTPLKSTANETFITLECIYSPSHPHTQDGSPFNFNLLLIITSGLLPFTSISLPLRPIWHPTTPSYRHHTMFVIICSSFDLFWRSYPSNMSPVDGMGWILDWVSQNERTDGFTLTEDDCTLCLHSIIIYFIPFTAKKSFCKAKSFPSSAFGCGPSSFTFHPSHPFSYVSTDVDTGPVSSSSSSPSACLSCWRWWWR